jgi:hypothetical protein
LKRPSLLWLGRPSLLRLRPPLIVAASRRSGLLYRLIQELEFAIWDHRVLVFASEELLFEQHVDAGRTLVGVLALEKTNGTSVLVAPENQLFFFLALRKLAPGRQRSHPDHGHYAHGHEQHDHRVPTVAGDKLTV